MKAQIALVFFLCITITAAWAQDDRGTGAWYMYFGNLRPADSPFSLHGEIQYRNHNMIGDLEQLLIRSGIQYNLPDNSATFTLGYGYIGSEPVGDEDFRVNENRIYQEALLRQGVSTVQLLHRFRYEQRFIDGQDFRTRFRYNLFINVPVTAKKFAKGGVYVALYNEIFINGERLDNIPLFDRNRLYGAMGYKLRDNLGVQLGYMSQMLNSRNQGQLQLSLHHNMTL
ncbi:DUF2490 domain-containing protein [Phaeodactylibacter luteus]|uniref:DUF2490 domain-containing protein n=1 Tax=Phaeodactylibacter luteus TaxID=1564516 RepID=A0A5C6S6R5_9BACT|nr:DUF2490 domain-containing protein [Phaeodactylibacter luteus]TXB69512.1 DUF2490 domain-containing protein [Phaeodactylibacter luteus]